MAQIVVLIYVPRDRLALQYRRRRGPGPRILCDGRCSENGRFPYCSALPQFEGKVTNVHHRRVCWHGVGVLTDIRAFPYQPCRSAVDLHALREHNATTSTRCSFICSCGRSCTCRVTSLLTRRLFLLVAEPMHRSDADGALVRR